MAQTTLPDFYIASWKVQPRLNQVTHGTDTVRLAPKFMQVLVYLAERAGEVVTREELMDTVWADTVVGEAVLTRAISALRKVFGDDPQQPKVIETILKTGYRFIAPLSFGDGALGGDSAGTRVAVDNVVVVPTSMSRQAVFRRAHWGVKGGIGCLVAVLIVWGFLAYNAQFTEVTAEVRLARPLTSLEGEEFDPSFSPDGQHVAFAWQTEAGTDIYVKTIATQQTQRLTAQPAHEIRPVWSPDGRHIAYIRCSSNKAAIEITPADVGLGQHVQSLFITDCTQAPRLAWSPDGGQLAYAERPTLASSKQIVLLALETGIKRVLTFPNEVYQDDQMPTFSPDGGRLAFVRGGAAGGQVYSVSVTGGTPRRLTKRDLLIEGLDWTPDGQQVVFASNGQLWHVRVADGSTHHLMETSTHLAQPTIARTGNQLVYAHARYDVNIWRVPIPKQQTTSGAEKIIASTLIDGDPRIAPDGERIVFISDRNGTCGLWLAHAHGAQIMPLVTKDINCMRMAMPNWSPDGKHVAYVSYASGGGDIFSVNTITGVVTQWTDTPSDEEAPSWSPDGKGLYFGSNRSGVWQVWRKHTVLGDAKQITQQGGYYAQVVPETERMIYTRFNEPGLWMFDERTGEDVQRLTGLHADDGFNWKITGQKLYYIERQSVDASPVLVHHDIASARSRPVTILPFASNTCVRFDLAPDASWAVFARVDYGGLDLALAEYSL